MLINQFWFYTQYFWCINQFFSIFIENWSINVKIWVDLIENLYSNPNQNLKSSLEFKLDVYRKTIWLVRPNRLSLPETLQAAQCSESTFAVKLQNKNKDKKEKQKQKQKHRKSSSKEIDLVFFSKLCRSISRPTTRKKNE